jgi:hypothetical protein
MFSLLFYKNTRKKSLRHGGSAAGALAAHQQLDHLVLGLYGLILGTGDLLDEEHHKVLRNGKLFSRKQILLLFRKFAS